MKGRADKMFGQDLDAMIEARNALEWEEQNWEMPAGDVEAQLNAAIRLMNEAYDKIAAAADSAEGFPMANKLDSILYDLENLQNELENYQREVKTA